ncbi:hypothetical protein V6N13_042166 [Hibiscus sabdariffa]
MQCRGGVGFVTLCFIALLQCLTVSSQVPAPHKIDLHWHPATATWYGSPDGDGSDGGACGYGSLVDVKPLRARVGAVSPVLFKNGEGCGACFKVKCLDKSICSRRAVTIIVTDECPGGYCADGRTHFDLSGAAFGRMAITGENSQLRNRGELPVVYRRTPCKYPGKNIAFHVNEGSTDHWLSLLVEFEDGDGDVGSMHIREANSNEWIEMSHVWGATCHGLLVNLGRQVIKWRTEVLIEGSPEDEIDALISESLMSLVKFKPASKLVEGLSSRKAYAVCSDAFSDGDEVASMPCHHVYHYNSVVLVELISNAIE